jgi:hypothetical protein
MPSYEYNTDDKSRAGSRYIARIAEELQKALFTEKSVRKLTQQAIADKLGVNRSVVNRQVSGLENMTARSIAEFLWAIGWEPHFEARKIEHRDGDNEYSVKLRSEASTTAGENSEPKRVAMDAA